MEDVFFGLYYWLDRHPMETVLVSMNYESGTGTPNDASLQERVYRILASELAKEYWMQNSGKVRFFFFVDDYYYVFSFFNRSHVRLSFFFLFG